MSRRKLPKSFYQRPTEQVAREWIGCILVHVVNGRRIAGRITETEAYLGVDDRACHKYGGRRTDRVKSMFLHDSLAMEMKSFCHDHLMLMWKSPQFDPRFGLTCKRSATVLTFPPLDAN